MPTVDRAALLDVGQTWLPKIRDAMSTATAVVADTSSDEAGFAETQPEGAMVVYAETGEAWAAARQGLHQILSESAANTDLSAHAVVRMAQNYEAAEVRASGILNGIARRLENLQG